LFPFVLQSILKRRLERNRVNYALSDALWWKKACFTFMAKLAAINLHESFMVVFLQETLIK